ncbi:MAG: cell division protein FtsL [Deltaproteobacteria bacterium]|nr:cell division protein FtsL [Deltaproteobacteria bacterium]
MNRRVSRKESAAVSSEKGSVKRPPAFFPIFRRQVSARVTESLGGRAMSTTNSVSKDIGIFHLLIICLSLIAAAAGMIYHLHVRFEGVRLGYEASEQRKIQTRLMLKRRELRLELASMKEPGRIEDEAREKLGMGTPKAEEFVHINKTKKVVSVSGGAL